MTGQAKGIGGGWGNLEQYLPKNEERSSDYAKEPRFEVLPWSPPLSGGSDVSLRR
jgi:hypothetical protein